MYIKVLDNCQGEFSLTRYTLFVSMQNTMMAESRENPVNKEFVSQRRIVVTGLGMITPLGLNAETTWNNLIAGKSGISSIDLKHTSIKVAGLIKDFNPQETLSPFVLPKDLRRLSRPAQLSLAATIEAFRNAGFLADNKLKSTIDPKRIGVRIGTGIGGSTEIGRVKKTLEEGKEISPFDALIIEPERVSSVVSMKLGLKGPLAAVTAACATGNIAITDGYKEIYMGDADIMVVGGVESAIDPVTFELFKTALSSETDPHKASRPFDKTRNGFVISEGVGILILEDYEHAKKRGARILAEMVGYGNTADAGHDTAPTGEGAEQAMRVALERSGRLPTEGTIYINAHATGTSVGDKIEVEAIRRVFLDLKNLAVSSTKGATGHLMGGAGAVEAIICIKALNDEVVPPTLNLEDPLDEGEGLNLVSKEPQRKPVKRVVNNGFGFGGINSAVVFKREE